MCRHHNFLEYVVVYHYQHTHTQFSGRSENGISLLGITGYAIILVSQRQLCHGWDVVECSSVWRCETHWRRYSSYQQVWTRRVWCWKVWVLVHSCRQGDCELTGVGKCELNTWEWENSKVACATLSVPYDITLLMQDTQYPTSNLVMSQLYQMITKFQMPSITYFHITQKETIPIHTALQKAFRSEMMKGILKARTQMVESMYRYFDSNLSESHRAKLYLHATRPKVQELQHVANAQVRAECTVMHRVYIVL